MTLCELLPEANISQGLDREQEGCWSDITYHIRENESAKNNSKIFPNDYLKSMLLDLRHFDHPR